MIKKIILLGFLSASAFAHNTGSQASATSVELSGQGVSEIVRGSFHLLQAGSQLPITAIRTVGDFTYVTLRVVRESGTVTLKVASTAVGESALATGQILQATSVGTGILLCKAGKIIAFVPNEAGKALLYNARA